MSSSWLASGDCLLAALACGLAVTGVRWGPDGLHGPDHAVQHRQHLRRRRAFVGLLLPAPLNEVADGRRAPAVAAVDRFVQRSVHVRKWPGFVRPPLPIGGTLTHAHPSSDNRERQPTASNHLQQAWLQRPHHRTFLHHASSPGLGR